MDGAARQAPGWGAVASGSLTLAASCWRLPSGIPLPRSEVTYHESFMLFTRAATRRGWTPEGGGLSVGAVASVHGSQAALTRFMNSSHLTRPLLQA